VLAGTYALSVFFFLVRRFTSCAERPNNAFAEKISELLMAYCLRYHLGKEDDS
jgi:hypothetical protein